MCRPSSAPDRFPTWSPDGNQVAYLSQRGNFWSIYRKAWDGTGNEEQLFQYWIRRARTVVSGPCVVPSLPRQVMV